jgi:tetratricopeptide (TPR) repeat protein
VRTYFQLGYWKDTTTLFSRALIVTGHNHVALACLAQEFEAGGDLHRALTFYRRAAAINPADAAVYGYDMARLHAELGELAKARELYEKSIALRPGYVDAHVNLAGVLSQQGDHDGATKEYERALALDANHPLANYNFGVELARNGHAAEALRHLERAAKLLPDQPEVFLAYGLALSDTRRREEALAPLRRAMELAREDGREDLAAEVAQRLRQFSATQLSTGVPATAPATSRPLPNLPPPPDNRSPH